MTATFIPDADAEAQFVASSSARFNQIVDYQTNATRVARVVEHYRKYPWTNPGLAVAFSKWKEAYGAGIAKNLARTAFGAVEAGGNPQDAIEAYAMTKEFKRQLKDRQGQQFVQKFGEQSTLSSLGHGLSEAVDYSGLGAIKGALEGAPLSEVVVRAIPGAKLATTAEGATLQGASALPVIGPGIKAASRVGFTALESPYQEIQGQAMQALTGLIGPIGNQAQPAPVGSEASRLGAVSGAPETQPLSSGGIALERLAQGKPVDLGTGFFPGGEIEKEHTQRLRDIASITYGGQEHFLTPGRTVAYATDNAFGITEPGSLPYNLLSGAVDATALIKTDPTLPALTYVGDLNRARQGFDLAKEVEQAGGFKDWWRTYTHGPTVQAYGDSENGQKFFRWAASLNPRKDFLTFMRATGWKIPGKNAIAIIENDTPEGVRATFEPLAGVAVREQPSPWSTGSVIRQSAGTRRIFNTRSTDHFFLDQLDGPGGGLDQFYNWMKNRKIPEPEISSMLHDLAGANSGFGSYEAINAAEAGKQAMIARGVPEWEANRTATLFSNDLADGSRYYVQQITDGAPVPGMIIDGTFFPETSPHLWVEALNPHVYLPSSGEFDKTMARYGRLLGIEGTGATEAGQIGNIARKSKYAAWSSDAFLTHVQSNLWVPLALLRGAWTLRVIGEEQIRMAASGLSNVFSHPIQHIATWMNTDTDRALTSETLRDAMENRGALTREAGGFFADVGSKKVVAKGKTIVTVDDPQHGKAWADELIKLHSDPVARTVANTVHTNGDLNAVKNAFWGEQPYQVFHGTHQGRVESILSEGLRPSRVTEHGTGETVTADFGGAGAFATSKAKVSWPSEGPAMIQAEIPAAEVTKYLDVPENWRELRGTADLRESYTLKETIPPKYLKEVPPTGAPTESAAQGSLVKWRDDLRENPQLRDIVATREGSDAYIDSVYKRVHDMTAGDGELMGFVATGKYGDPNRSDISIVGREVIDEGMDPTNKGLVTSHKPGHTMAQVYFDGADEPIGVPVADLTLLDDSPARARTMAHDGVRVDPAFISYLNDKPAKPFRLVGDVVATEPQHGNWLDRAVRTAFSTLMAKPSNYLSRSPVFKQKYWERVIELMPTADARTQALALNVAEEAGLPKRYIDALTRLPGAKTGELTYQEVDDLAKGHALDSVRDLLYDLNRRSQFFDATRLLFPFGEAWKEILTRWARIPFEHPEVARKFQIGITALRETSPQQTGLDKLGGYAAPYQNQGFFFKDPATGQEAFAYPWSHQLTDATVGIPVPFTGQVSGLSLAFNVMPGIGPVAQVAANAFMDKFLANPKYDAIRSVLFPYGEPDFAHGIVESFLPAWLQKWTTALGVSKEDSRVLNNTTFQVLAYGQSTGEYDLNSKEGVQVALADAQDKAALLYIVRGSFQWGAPAAPNPRFLVETKKGVVLNTTLRDEFYRLTQKDQDTSVAKFLDRFGEKAFYATGSFTLSGSYASPFTKDQVQWARDNPQLSEKYPTVYGFFAPPGDPKDYDYDAYLRSIVRGEKTPLPLKDWPKQVNQSLGFYWYDVVRQKMGLEPGDTGNLKQRTFLAEVRDKIRKAYPGWQDVESTPNKVAHAVEELQAASKDRGLKRSNPDLTGALATYFKARTNAIKAVQASGGTSEFGRPGFESAAKYAPLREWLRGIADQLEKRTPAFANVYDSVLGREVEEP